MGLLALENALNKGPRANDGVLTEDVVNLAKMALTNNNYVFNGKHYSGTSI